MNKTSCLVVPTLIALVGLAASSPLLKTATAATPAPTPWTEVRGPDVVFPAIASLGMGRVLFGAGYPVGATIVQGFKNMSIYDAASNTWSASTPLPDDCAVPSMASLGDGTVLASGGIQLSQGGCSSLATVFSADSQTWTKVGNMITERFTHGLATLGHETVLAAGGAQLSSSGGFTTFPSAEIFEQKTGNWRSVANMTTPRSAFALVGLSDGRALACGGQVVTDGNFSLLDSAEIYDPTTNAWTIVSAMSTPRSGAAASILSDGRVLVAGGTVHVTGGAASSAEVYDPTSDSWSAVDPMPEARNSFGAALTDHGVVLAGGDRALSTALIFHAYKYSCSDDKGCYASPTGVPTLTECESFCQPDLYTCVLGTCKLAGVGQPGVPLDECRSRCTKVYACKHGECVLSNGTGVPLPTCEAACTKDHL